MSKSLGTLTLDLIARVGAFTAPMKQASDTAKKEMQAIGQSVKAGATAIAAVGAAAVAAGAGVVAFTNNAAQNAREMKNLAGLANSSVEEFQKFAYASKTVGIEQDKLADILKDVNDRVGDFLTTGGGEMADFFENIAPKVGVTAEQFAKLSGPQAIGLYVQSLQKAGLSQQEMTFYMEALADDATRLIPLLKDGGEGFKAMAAEAESLGIVLTELDIAKLEEFASQFDRLTAILGAGADIIAAELAPYLSVMADNLVDAAEGAGGLREQLPAALSESVAALGPLLDGLQLVRIAVSGLQSFAYTMYEAYSSAFEFIQDNATAFLDVIMGGINEVIEAFNKIPGIGDVPLIDSFNDSAYMNGVRSGAAEISKLADEARADLMELVNGPMPSATIDQYLKDVEEKARQLREKLDSEAADTVLGASSLAGKNSKDKSKSLDVRGDALLERLAAEERSKAILDAQAAEFEATRKNLDQRYAIEEEYQNRIQALRDGKRLGLIESQAEFDALMIASEEQRNEKLLELNGGYWEKYLAAAEENLTSFDELTGNMLENFSNRFGDAFESMVFDAETLGEAVRGMAEGMARSVVNALGQMAAQWIAYQAVQMALGKASEAAAVSGAAIAGPAIAASYAPAAAAASLATLGTNTAPAIAGIGAAAAAATSAFVGMAHDGIDSVPQTGTWLLQKGERVTTAETSAKLDRTLDQIGKGGGGAQPVQVTNVFQVSAGVAGTVRAEIMKTIPMITEMTKNSVQNAINSGGPMSRAVGRRS